MRLKHFLFCGWVFLAIYSLVACSEDFDQSCVARGGKVTAGAPFMYWQNTGNGMGHLQTIYPTVCEK
jgi:hypothetical protein